MNFITSIDDVASKAKKLKPSRKRMLYAMQEAEAQCRSSNYKPYSDEINPFIGIGTDAQIRKFERQYISYRQSYINFADIMEAYGDPRPMNDLNKD